MATNQVAVAHRHPASLFLHKGGGEWMGKNETYASGKHWRASRQLHTINSAHGGDRQARRLPYGELGGKTGPAEIPEESDHSLTVAALPEALP